MTENDATPISSSTRGDATRAALLRAAVDVFARDGFHAVSTRALAQAAGVNQALIGYHFGGKEGIYLAVFEDIVAQMQTHLGPMAQSLAALASEDASELSPAERRERYLPAVLGICDRMLLLMLGEQTMRWSQLILREQQRPTAAFEVLYQGFMGRMLGLLTGLVQRVRGEDSPERSRLIVVGILGQVLVWRAARAGVFRHLGWTLPAEEEIEIARDTVRRSVEAQVFA